MRSIILVAAALAFAASGAKAQEGRLTLYTSQPNTDAQRTVDAFHARYPKLEVSFVRDGTPRILARLKAEIAAGDPKADCLLIADSLSMEELKREGLLLAYDKADISAFPAGIHDRDKSWFATKLITTGIVYNIHAAMKPSSWADLARPEAKGLTVLPSPLASGAALIHTVTLSANLKEGWRFYEVLKANGAIAIGGNGDVLRQVAGGEKLYGMIVDFMPIREKAKGAPVEFVFPAEGVSAVSEPVAILRSSKNPEAAKAFVDFLLSPDGQRLALEMGYIPALPTLGLPPGYPERSAIRLMPFDPVATLATEAEDRRRFESIFGQ